MNFKLTLRIIALLGAAVGIAVLWLSFRGPSSFPERQALVSVTGPVIWVSPDRYSTRFGLTGDSRSFAYAHKSGDRTSVASALADVSKHPVTILVKPSEPQQGVAGGPFFQVYELSSNQGPVRSYAQVRAAWESDYRYGYLAALLAFVAAGFLEYVARRAPPNNSSKPKPLRGSA